MSKSNRWQRRITDFSHVRTGSNVRVQMGAGMVSGTMIQRRRDHVMVQLMNTKRIIAVWDARNIN